MLSQDEDLVLSTQFVLRGSLTNTARSQLSAVIHVPWFLNAIPPDPIFNLKGPDVTGSATCSLLVF